MRRPNFLFLFPDQHRYDWLGCRSDLPLNTPNLDAIAENGVVFTQAFTPSALCSPARACLATGRDYHRCRVINNQQNTPLNPPNYYRALRDAGYRVAGVGKFDLHKPDMDWGLRGENLIHEYGFTEGIDSEGKGDAILAYFREERGPKGPYMQFLRERGWHRDHIQMYLDNRTKGLCFPAVTPLPDDCYSDNWIAENGLRILSDFPHEKPWHLVVNFTGPHDPYDVTRTMRDRWVKVDFPSPHDNHDDPEETLTKRQNYAAMIENVDRHVGRFIDLVRQRGEIDNTIIVYSSDHGEMLGDHGRWAKGNWYDASARIPLIIKGPGIERQLSSNALVSLTDLASTFIDYAHAAPLPDTDSRSLRPLLEGETTKHREVVLSGLNDWRMVFDGQHKLVLSSDRPPVLFNCVDDPMEDTNVAEEYPDRVKALTDTMPPGFLPEWSTESNPC